ncbi:MAG: GDP-mannose 4,6-dehydratase [Bacteroidetes bacterium]|nr:GDP-mannose 4,6-dehydratase [Bacteroidota bacterium]
MTILITGVAGFIGSNLADALTGQDDIRIIGIDNFDNFYPRDIKEANLSGLLPKANFNFIEGDIRDTTVVDSILENNKIDIVIHLAAKAGVRPSMENPLNYISSNVEGTTNLLESMRRHGVNKMVFASSSSVYGENEKIPFSESDAIDRIISIYAATKLSGEKITKVYHDVYGFSIVNLRFFTVYGERQRPDLAIHKFFKSILKDEPITVYGDGSTSRDYTYVKDIVSGIIASKNYVLQHDHCYEVMNLGNNDPVKLMDLIRHIEAVTGRQARLEHKPIPTGDVPRTYADITKAQQLLGYSPTTHIAEGLKAFYQWYEKTQLSKIK